MSVNIMTIASSVAPSFTNNYPTTTWSAKRAYAHFGNEAFGVNGLSITTANRPQIQKGFGAFFI